VSFLNHLVDLLHQHAQGQTQPPTQYIGSTHAHAGAPIPRRDPVMNDPLFASGMADQLGQADRFMFRQPQPFHPLQVQPRSPIQYGDQGMQMQGGFGTDPQHQFSNNSLQGYNQNDLDTGIQGGVVNQGYIPLQSTRFKR
jgi:hypothetical protein